jgi:hypothetical protein
MLFLSPPTPCTRRTALPTKKLIMRVAELCHIELAKPTIAQLNKGVFQLERGFEFLDPDLVALNTRVIHTNFMRYVPLYIIYIIYV